MSLLDKLLPPPSPDQFARLIVEALRMAGMRQEIRYDKEQFSLSCEQPELRPFLKNVYEEYLSTPRQKRAGMLARYASMSLQTREDNVPSGFESARQCLLPRVRSRLFHEAARYVDDDPHRAIPHQLLADHLTIDLVYDLPAMMAIVSDEQLKEWGVSFDEALAVARENLWRISNENFIEIQPSLYRSPWNDSHGSARLFLHDLIWQLEVKGGHVVLVPNRQVLLVTGSEDAEGLQQMARLGEKLVQEDRQISAVPVVLEGSEWRTWNHIRDGGKSPKLRRLCIQGEAQEYGEQKEYLDKWYARQGEGVFVASVMLADNEKAGELWSIAVWPDGIETLLPKTTHVAFMSTQGQSRAEMRATARFEDVLKALGDRMQPCGMYPERYRVSSFPTPEEIERIKLEL